jgi:hypothetical protein
MGRAASITLAGSLALIALLCDALGQVRAESVPRQFDAKTFQAASTKAAEYCTTLWSDHAFDPLRDKIPLLGEQPTSSMLANPQRVRREDKPLADLALKTTERCKAAIATAWAMLPLPVHDKVLSLMRQADALNIQLYRGKITFGEYNVKRLQILEQMQLAFASIRESSAVERVQSSVIVAETTPSPPVKPLV